MARTSKEDETLKLKKHDQGAKNPHASTIKGSLNEVGKDAQIQLMKPQENPEKFEHHAPILSQCTIALAKMRAFRKPIEDPLYRGTTIL